MALAIESISKSLTWKSLFFSVAATKAHRNAILRSRSGLQQSGRIMTEKLYDHDSATSLESEEAISGFLADALETGNAGYVAKALGIVARAKGMSELTRETGLSREQLYRSFSERGNPTLKTLFAVTRALGVDLTTRPHEPPSVSDDRQVN